MNRSGQLDQVIAGVLAAAGLTHEHHGPGSFSITLPGTKKLRTTCWVLVGQHGVLVEAFVCRRPDEAHEDVYRLLLRRNTRLYGVHYALDKAGDIYLIGRLPHHGLTADELDRVLGQVLETADGDFNTLLELGFASSIRREWAWRVARGESLHNLAAFEHLVR
ncbi:MAG: YbjN domain-containing protein [Pseudonocardiaceae bacterium]